MAQVTSGIRSIFTYPMAYNTFQVLVGASHARENFVGCYLGIKNVARLLDIGCGTAELLQHLPEMTFYVGFDVSVQYIDSAKRRFCHRHAEFVADQVTGTTLAPYEPFDRVAAMGLLHHLDDCEVINLLQLAKGKLKNNGFFVSIDPCYVDNQSLISKVLIDHDRGQNVRTVWDYKCLAGSVFKNVAIHHRNDLLRIPYDHAIMICS